MAQSGSHRERLGTRLFTYQSVAYFRTNRSRHTIAGTQLRQISERSIVRITTREQTLLDTLHRPISCGGPSVVWEAWQSGIRDLDEQRLTEHLIILDDPKWLRRVGFLLSALAYTPSAALQQLLDATQEALAADRAAPAIPLFPGLPSVGTDPTWRLELPV